MKRWVAGLIVFTCIILGQGPSTTARKTPVLTLTIWPADLQVKKQNGVGSFNLDVTASKQFEGPASGSISISDPANPDHVVLTEGASGRNLSFSLFAGTKISDKKALAFRVRTASTNRNTGALTYSIFLNVPDHDFIARNAAQQVRVKVTADEPH